MIDPSRQIAELGRRLDNLIALGVVAEVDAGAARARARVGARTSAWLPWLTRRAGDAADWWAPSAGEQVLVLSPGGDPELGVILPAIYADARPAPSADPARQVIALPDGGALEIRCAGVTLVLDAAGLSLAGSMTATGEVTASGIPLSTHLHGGVTPGLQETDEPTAGGGIL